MTDDITPDTCQFIHLNKVCDQPPDDRCEECGRWYCTNHGATQTLHPGTYWEPEERMSLCEDCLPIISGHMARYYREVGIIPRRRRY